MCNRITRLQKYAAAIVLGIVVLGGASARADDSPPDCEGKPYVVKIHADWCGSCKATEVVWERVRRELGSRTTVVKLDVSDRIQYNRSLAEAQRLEIEDFFEAYRSQTGVVAILDCRTREPVAILNGEPDFEKYLQAVERAGRTS